MTRDLDADLALAVSAAQEALALITRLRAEGVEVSATKTSPVDVVTAADEAAEALLRERLLAARPDDGLLGEEGDDVAGTSGHRWVVDPIDGTVNYLYGRTAHCVSVALQEGTTSVVGVIASADGRLGTAIRGRGSLVDDRPARVRDAVPLEQSLVATGFSYDAEVRAAQGRAVAAMLPRVRDVRRSGSCALDLLDVATGRVDAYVESGTHEWDRAAAGLIATEAGARLEVCVSTHGDDLVVCAPEETFVQVRRLVADVGMIGNNPQG